MMTLLARGFQKAKRSGSFLRVTEASLFKRDAFQIEHPSWRFDFSLLLN